VNVKIDPKYRPEACVRSDGERLNLSAPYLDVNLRRVVATDGRMLVAVPVEVEPRDASGFIGPSQLDIARDRQPRGTFPDWTAIVPPFREGQDGTVTIGLSAALLSSLADALGCDGRRQVALTWKPDEPFAPMLVRAAETDAHPDALGLLMPVKIDVRRPTPTPAEPGTKENAK
jgi:hypothetical protein